MTGNSVKIQVEDKKQQNLDLIKDLENKLQNETDPSKRKGLEKALKTMKLVIDLIININK